MSPIVIAVISILLLLASTIAGASFVYFFRKGIPALVNNLILGFAGGVMMAASFFCLLEKAVEGAESVSAYRGWHFVPILVGFLVGVLILFVFDRCSPHMHSHGQSEEGQNHHYGNTLKFIIAFSLHNIPEGISIGIACGLAINNPGDTAACLAVLLLAIGSAIHNIPLGSAISVPLLSDGMKKNKAFSIGVFCAFIEPVFALLGLFLSTAFSSDFTALVTPWLLSLAAGAIIYVTLDEILPEARKGGYEHAGLLSFVLGFVLLMALELVF